MEPDNDLPHSQLQHLVAERLRTAILEGLIRPGQWLRQRQVAEEFNVSQMPVREALKALASEGLVAHIPYRGVRVVGFSVDDVEDLYAHRSLLEGMAARAAARNITEEELERLRTLQQRMIEHMDKQYIDEYRALNRQFHQTIILASRRAYLTRALTQIWDAFPTMLWSNFLHTAAEPLPERDASDAGEHEAVLKALEARDADQAEYLMRQHIQAAGRELVAMLRAEESNLPK